MRKYIFIFLPLEDLLWQRMGTPFVVVFINLCVRGNFCLVLLEAEEWLSYVALLGSFSFYDFVIKFICCKCDTKRQAFVLVMSGALVQVETFCSFRCTKQR